MILELQSYPDAKFASQKFSIGQLYEIVGEIGNCFKVQHPVDPDPYIILKSRFGI